MQAQTLQCRDLKPRDIMLKVGDSAITSRAINFGQSLVGSRNPNIVHAGIMFDSYYMIEAQGAGLLAHDLRVQNRPYGYYVYRCGNPSMATGAGTCAKMMFDIHKTQGSMRYNFGGAIGSLFGAGGGRSATPAQMDDLLDNILSGRSRPFFCSQFVVYVYQFVAEQNMRRGDTVFSMSDAKATPSALASSLVNKPMFNEVGAMFPNER